jgi:sedoheptulose-bisphosphatase
MRAGDMVASVVCVYGPRCTLFVSVKGGACYEYMLHDWAGREQQFGLVRKKPCALAPRAQIIAPGNLRAASVDAGYLRFVQEAIKRKWTLRYSGAMCPDVAQLLVKGNGIFSTPAIAPFTVKLRMCFEVSPIALMCVCAGGAARCGSGAFGDVLDERITSLDQRASIICGSKDSVAELVQMLQESSSSKQGAALKASSKL